MGSNKGRFRAEDDKEVAAVMPSFVPPLSAAQSL